MSFWSQQLEATSVGSMPPPAEDGVPPANNGYETDEDQVRESSPSAAVLSPQIPSPTRNVYLQHHPSPLLETTTQLPNRSRPLDPVFKSAEGTFPITTLPNVGENQSSIVDVFVPSVQGNDDLPLKEAPRIPSPTANKDSSLDVKVNAASAAQEYPTTAYTTNRASEKAAIPDPTPPNPRPPPSISRATRRVPPPPPPPPRLPPTVGRSTQVETNSVASAPEDPPPPLESESSDNEFVVSNPRSKTSQMMFTPTVDRIGRRSTIGVGETFTSATNGDYQMIPFETPNRLIRPSPKFVFLSDQKMVPDNIKRLEEATMKRRREVLVRMKQLDCRIVRLVSSFAEEKMDLDLAIRDTLDRSVCHPLEASVERLTVERESSAERGPVLLGIEKRISALDREITKHIYMNMSDARREELDSLQSDLSQEIIPSIRLEDSKSDKIEGGVVRRFENVAGVAARQFHQETAARRASVEFVKKQCQAAVEKEHQHGDDVLNTIKELRAQVHRERLQRQANDKIILDEIIRTTVTMKRAMLSAISPSK